MKVLKKATGDLKTEKLAMKNMRKKETLCLRRVDLNHGLEKSTWFHTSFNNMEHIYYSLRRICEPAYEHVDNNFSPIPQEYADKFTAGRDELVWVIRKMSLRFEDKQLSLVREEEEKLDALQHTFSTLRKELMADIQSKNINLSVAYLYLNLIQESEQLSISLKAFARSSRKLV